MPGPAAAVDRHAATRRPFNHNCISRLVNSARFARVGCQDPFRKDMQGSGGRDTERDHSAP
jgi:hypothetical protein